MANRYKIFFTANGAKEAQRSQKFKQHISTLRTPRIFLGVLCGSVFKVFNRKVRKEGAKIAEAKIKTSI